MVMGFLFIKGLRYSPLPKTYRGIKPRLLYVNTPKGGVFKVQYHEVKVILEFRQKNECYVTADTLGNCGINIDSKSDSLFCVPSLEAASLYVDYIYLDTDERRRFAQVSHEYLIEQLQFTGDESITSQNIKVKLNFNHPVKELVWVIQRDSVIQLGMNQWNNYTDDFDNDTHGKIQSNGLLDP